ncbi:MAG: TVP38/TMEM64 family protein [Ruminococcus sp.]
MKKIKFLSRFIPVLIFAALIAIYLLSGRRINAESIIDMIRTENLVLAAVILLAFYALKSLSLFFPIMALYIAGGIIFPPPAAILVNTAGTFICLNLPYIVGKLWGSRLISSTADKYPRIERFISQQRQREFFLSFFLRAVRVFPTDIVSLYSGAVKFSYAPYIIAGMLGEMPGIICETLIGISLGNTSSTMLILSAALTAGITAISGIWYYIQSKIDTP